MHRETSSSEVCINGFCLSALLDEAWETNSNSQGLLFGHRGTSLHVSNTDNGEDMERTIEQIHITSFVNARHHRPFENHASFEEYKSLACDSTGEKPVGMLIIRRDKQRNLSFNDMRAAKLFCGLFGGSSKTAILVINVPREKNQSWIFSSHHTLLLADPPRSIFDEHVLIIENPPKDTSKVFDNRPSCNLNSFKSGSASSRDALQKCKKAAVTGLEGYFGTQLMMSDLVQSIKDEMLQVVELDKEINELRCSGSKAAASSSAEQIDILFD